MTTQPAPRPENIAALVGLFLTALAFFVMLALLGLAFFVLLLFGASDQLREMPVGVALLITGLHVAAFWRLRVLGDQASALPPGEAVAALALAAGSLALLVSDWTAGAWAVDLSALVRVTLAAPSLVLIWAVWQGWRLGRAA